MDPTYTLCTDCLDVFEGEPFIVPAQSDVMQVADDMAERPVCLECYQNNHEKSWRDIG